MTDTESHYLNNAALTGGIFYIEYSTVTLTGVEIETTYAVDGGVFYGYDKSTLTVQSSSTRTSTITATSVLGQGGIGYFAENPSYAVATDTYKIVFKDTSIATTEAYLEGGAFYLDSEQLVHMTLETVTMTGTSSKTKAGGVIYVNSMKGPLFISNSQFT